MTLKVFPEKGKKMKLVKQLTIIAILLSAIFLAGCGDVKVVTITSDGTFSSAQCKEHNPDQEIVMFESKYCSHCQETLPIFLEACNEKEITPIILDVTNQEEISRMHNEYKINIQYTPTFLFGCDYFVGAQKTKEDYISLIETYEQLRGEI